MSENLKMLRQNTDRRFAILMTAIQDFVATYQQERNETDALLGVQEKAVQTRVAKQTATPKTKRNISAVEKKAED